MALFTLLRNAAKGERGGVPRRDDVIYLANQSYGWPRWHSFWDAVNRPGHQQQPPVLPAQTGLMKQGSEVGGFVASTGRTASLPVRVGLLQLYK